MHYKILLFRSGCNLKQNMIYAAKKTPGVQATTVMLMLPTEELANL
jgi:hypothetical protein